MSLSDNIKSIISTIRKYKDPELMDQVVNLQKSVLGLQERVGELEKENQLLKKKMNVQESLVVEHQVYFSKKADKKDGPFCTRCWDMDNKLLRLEVLQNGIARCPQCKYEFTYLYNGSSAIYIAPRTWPDF